MLLDIDGTLLHGRPEAHTVAMTAAMAQVWGVPAQPDDVWGIDPGGRTDREIARLVLRTHGVDDSAINAQMDEWIVVAIRMHVGAAGDHPAPVAASDAADALDALTASGAETALLTGNLETIGRAKVVAAGLGAWFPPGGGGFGSDAEVRADLVAIARDRSSVERPGHRIVVVGDTPRDIVAARAAGVRVVAVTTGRHGQDELAGADHVCADLMTAAQIILT